MKNRELKDVYFVGLQILLFVIYFIPFHQFHFIISPFLSVVFFAIGILGLLIILIAIMQLNKNLTPFPTPKKNGVLIQTGLYKYIRHPIYSGIILAVIDFGLYAGSFWKIGIGVCLIILFYFKSKYEESLLLKQFDSYREYSDKTFRFFPFL